MILVYDNDKPITAAERIITAEKEPETLAQAITAQGKRRQQYSVRELLEIAQYLLAYVDMHKGEYIEMRLEEIADGDGTE